MSEPTSEFSRLVPLARLASQPLQIKIEATAEERERLAGRFGLMALDRLAADVALERVGDELIRLDVAFEAEFAQSCVVTLDPVPGRIAESFSLVYGPSSGEQLEIDIAVDEPVFEPLTGEAIDIGEAVAQELSLALPQFPRLPDAAVEPADAFEAEEGPFASLARLRRFLTN